MATIFPKAAGITAAILFAAAAAWAVCDQCKYTNRGDRFEGVEDWQVSGSSFDLLAVQYRPSDAAGAASGRLSVFFWLPAPLTPTIEVREPDHNYMMHPAKKQYANGLHSFSWPAGEVIAPLGIKPSQLFAKVSNREETLYFPAFLSQGSAPSPGGVYSFVFRSGAGLDVDCTILRDEGGAPVMVSKWDCSSDFGGKIAIQWNGRDGKGQPAPPGRYLLRIKGDLLAESPRPLNTTIAFQHYGRFD